MLRIAQPALAFSCIKQGKSAAPSRSSLPPSFPPTAVVFSYARGYRSYATTENPASASKTGGKEKKKSKKNIKRKKIPKEGKRMASSDDYPSKNKRQSVERDVQAC